MPSGSAWPLRVTPVCVGQRPLSRQARQGVHSGELLQACVKTVLSCASSSSRGVWTSGWPSQRRPARAQLIGEEKKQIGRAGCRHLCVQPLMPERLAPWMNCFWKRKKTTSTGMTIITVAAICWCCMPPWPGSEVNL